MYRRLNNNNNDDDDDNNVDDVDNNNNSHTAFNILHVHYHYHIFTIQILLYTNSSVVVFLHPRSKKNENKRSASNRMNDTWMNEWMNLFTREYLTYPRENWLNKIKKINK